MPKDDVPEWAWERAAELANCETAGMYVFTADEGPNPAFKALARYIAAQEVAKSAIIPLDAQAALRATERGEAGR